MNIRTGIFAAVLAGLLLGAKPADVSAYGNASCRVFDQSDVLDTRQEEELNQEMREIYDTYGADAVILAEPYIYGDDRRCAAEFMQEYDVGGSSGNNAVCLLHQVEERTVAVVFRGDIQADFNEEVQDLILDDCIAYLSEGDYFGAYQAVLKDYRNGLDRLAQGKTIRPMDIDGGGIVPYFLRWLLISFAVTAIPVFLLTMHQRSRMKTMVPQTNADQYIPVNGVNMEVQRDIYLRTVTTRMRIPRANGPSAGTGRGGGGSFSVGGESFSGSSRKY